MNQIQPTTLDKNPILIVQWRAHARLIFKCLLAQIQDSHRFTVARIEHLGKFDRLSFGNTVLPKAWDFYGVEQAICAMATEVWDPMREGAGEVR
jgi:hypothetical protein